VGAGVILVGVVLALVQLFTRDRVSTSPVTPASVAAPAPPASHAPQPSASAQSAEDAEQTIERLVREVGDTPENAVAHYNLAVLYEERGSWALAYDHYNAFLRHAGLEDRALLTDAQRRLRLIESRIEKTRP
jgi:hypothetical protein